MPTGKPVSGRVQSFKSFVWATSPERPLWQRETSRFLRILSMVARDVQGGLLTLRAMSLVYTTLLSFVPLLAVSFSVLKGFGVHNQLEPVLLNFLAPLGDKAETRAIKSVFGAHADELSISSTKSQLGHSLGASGGIELVLTTKAVLEDTVPPTINLDDPDPECDLDYTPIEPKKRKLTCAMSNSFGFGGHNASIIVRKYES